MTPMEHVDKLWQDYQAGLDRGEAIAGIRAHLDVTEYGAGEMLDHQALPSTRRAEALSAFRLLVGKS